MNLYMAKQIVKDYNAILISESNDETFIKVREIANEFMDMLCDNYPKDTDAIALVCNFGLVAMEQGDTLMLALTASIFKILTDVTSAYKPMTH